MACVACVSLRVAKISYSLPQSVRPSVINVVSPTIVTKAAAVVEVVAQVSSPARNLHAPIAGGDTEKDLIVHKV